jgi:hypothetical protein
MVTSLKYDRERERERERYDSVSINVDIIHLDTRRTVFIALPFIRGGDYSNITASVSKGITKTKALSIELK